MIFYGHIFRNFFLPQMIIPTYILILAIIIVGSKIKDDVEKYTDSHIKLDSEPEVQIQLNEIHVQDNKEYFLNYQKRKNQGRVWSFYPVFFVKWE